MPCICRFNELPRQQGMFSSDEIMPGYPNVDICLVQPAPSVTLMWTDALYQP
jgi:hypothetical protein